jgi:hypothetical protein
VPALVPALVPAVAVPLAEAELLPVAFPVPVALAALPLEEPEPVEPLGPPAPWVVVEALLLLLQAERTGERARRIVAMQEMETRM